VNELPALDERGRVDESREWLNRRKVGMSRTSKTLVALATAAIVLVLVAWFDNTLMSEARRHAAATFDVSGVGAMIALGSLLVAGSILLVGTLAWRAASVVVGLAYVLVGGFFVALPWLVWNLATTKNDVPPVLPEALARPSGPSTSRPPAR
jgi:hypothetical protein